MSCVILKCLKSFVFVIPKETWGVGLNYSVCAFTVDVFSSLYITDAESVHNIPFISGKRTLHNPFKGRDRPWDPHGIAKFDLSGLLLGQQVMHLKSAVRPCVIPDVLGVRDGKQDGKLIGINGALDGPSKLFHIS